MGKKKFYEIGLELILTFHSNAAADQCDQIWRNFATSAKL